MTLFRRWFGRCIATLALFLLAACSSIQPSGSSQPPPIATEEVASLDEDALGALLALTPNPPVQSTTQSKEASLVHALAERFKKPEALIQRVVDAANRFAYKDYPLRDNLLAIIAVESSFNPKASHRGSKGLMQILASVHRKSLNGKNVFAIDDNVEIGSSILRGYYEELGKKDRNAILAYNAGIGSFLKKKYNPEYYSKYAKELAFIRSITQ